MKDEDKYIAQIPPDVMVTEERLDEVATYMAREVARLCGHDGWAGVRS